MPDSSQTIGSLSASVAVNNRPFFGVGFPRSAETGVHPAGPHRLDGVHGRVQSSPNTGPPNKRPAFSAFPGESGVLGFHQPRGDACTTHWRHPGYVRADQIGKARRELRRARRERIHARRYSDALPGRGWHRQRVAGDMQAPRRAFAENAESTGHRRTPRCCRGPTQRQHRVAQVHAAAEGDRQPTRRQVKTPQRPAGS